MGRRLRYGSNRRQAAPERPRKKTFLKTLPDGDLKRVLRLQPEVGVPMAQHHQAPRRNPSPFTVAERELIAAYVSGLNACDFRAQEHDVAA